MLLATAEAFSRALSTKTYPPRTPPRCIPARVLFMGTLTPQPVCTEWLYQGGGMGQRHCISLLIPCFVFECLTCEQTFQLFVFAGGG